MTDRGGHGIHIEEVRIRNFRSLRSVDVTLHPQTVLIGGNNAGKTSFLDAIHAAIGAGRRTVGGEDVTLLRGEASPPKDRSILVDILIRPTADNGERLEALPEGSPWTELWGLAIGQDDDGDEFVAFRMKTAWSPSRGEYYTERHFLSEWGDSDEIQQAPVEGDLLRANQIEPLAFHYLEASRDILGDMVGRSSLWARLVSEPGLPDDTVEDIEKSLNDINGRVLEDSRVLAHVQDNLRELEATVGCDRDSVRITPLSRRLADMKKGMDVVLAAKQGPSFPLSRQGMGTRSVATILTLRAFMLWKLKTMTDEAFHPFVGVEEPETHLQPQAQRSIMRQLSEIPGQRIVTTHSPNVVIEASIEEICHFQKVGNETVVRRIDTSDLSDEDIRKINRQVLNTRGDLLFGRGVVLFEGETEEQAIPVFAEEYWGRPPAQDGLSLVGVGGSGGYLPFLRLASRFGIPWYILSDGEPDALKKLDKALKSEKLPGAQENERVFVIPDEMDFEGYIAALVEHQQALLEMFADLHATNSKHREALLEGLKGEGPPDQVIASKLRSKKTMYGAQVGHTLVSSRDRTLRVPGVIESMLAKVSMELGLSKDEGKQNPDPHATGGEP